MILSLKFLKFSHIMFLRSGNPLLIFLQSYQCLPCLGDIKNPGRLPVQHVLGGTGECVL